MKTLFLGDLSPTNISSLYFKNGDKKALFGDILPLFKDQDFLFVNLECALTEADHEISKIGPPLKAPLEVAEVLSQIGITVCGLSNNHIFDYGKKGVEDTMLALRAAEVAHTGFGKNYDESRHNFVFSANGERICVIAVCEHEYSYALEDRMGARPYDEYDTIEDIRKASETSDKLIVIYHGGKEQCRYPSPRLYKACHAMARAGADVILCQHSHCIGCYEEYENCHILYGQGNFHFVKPRLVADGLEGWGTGLMVCYDTQSNHIEFIPIVMNQTGVELAKGEEKTAIIEAFKERNAMLLDGTWREGWHDFCIHVEKQYKGILSKVCVDENSKLYNEFFGHYIDCEAHADVFRELFPTHNLTNEK